MTFEVAFHAEDISNLIKVTIALFIIVDPLGNIPIFIGLTGKLAKDQRRRVFRSAAITGFGSFVSFCYCWTTAS